MSASTTPIDPISDRPTRRFPRWFLRAPELVFRLRLDTVGEQAWDLPRAGAWTLREIAVHVGTSWYAEQVGDLSTR